MNKQVEGIIKGIVMATIFVAVVHGTLVLLGIESLSTLQVLWIAYAQHIFHDHVKHSK